MLVTRKRPKANQTTSTVLTTTTTQYAGEITSVTNNSYTLSGASGSATIASIYQSGPNGPISYNLGNELSQFSSYDTLGRMSGGWVCIGAPSLGCPNQHYGFVRNMTGSRINGSTQDYVGTGITYQYDDFNRLSGMQTSSGVAPYSYTYSYNYDRYGNRWQQNASGGATFSQSFNPKNNQIVSSSYQYDAAGNMTNDSFNRYTYDAEGNILTVGNGQTATYVYNALNQKVKSVTSSGVLEFLFDPQGRQTSVWTASPNATASESHIYNDSTQFAFRSGDGHTYFIHKDWVNSDRVHTDLNGATAAVYTKLPFGDGGSATVSETDGGWDFGRFGDMDYNGETNTYHAQFRQYSQAQGRWLSPDPYDGSYDPSNPQSFNRYAYVLNNPRSLTDPTGQDGCTTPIATDPGTFAVSCGASVAGDALCGPLCGEIIGDVAGGIAVGLEALFGFDQPSFHGSLQPRPNAANPTSYASYSYQGQTVYQTGATIQVNAIGASIPNISPWVPTVGEFVEGAEIAGAAVGTAALAIGTTLTMEGDNRGCMPQAGTQCYEEHYGHTHNGWDPHSHIWTMNQNPVTKACFWNRGAGPAGATQFPPTGMYPCSVYPTWNQLP